MTELLAAPLSLPCGARLPNRIAKAAMSEQLGGPAGEPTEGLVRLYECWGRGGAGLLLSGNVMLDARRCGEAANVVVEDDKHADLLGRWAKAATAHGAHLWMQINHPGRQAPKFIDPHPVAPSEVPMKMPGGAFARPRALQVAEIEDIIARFARTSAIAKQAGFTGVQIHGAHGYLISQFLSPMTNLRDDAWGGDSVRRRRFLLEVVRAVRAAVGADFPVSVKLNSADFQRGGFDEEESMHVVAMLAEQRIDLLEVSGGTYERATMFDGQTESTRKREAFFLEYAEKVRSVATMPLMVTGGFRTRAGMEAALASGAVDVIGLARPLAVEPDLPRRLLTGEAEAALTIDLETRSKLLNAMIPGAWHQQQLRRMAAGKQPNPSLSRLSAVLRYAADLIKQGRRVRRGV
jgi:2,4-dienoyl-CoA reductase-like NADH-dependent reductase (Old Yellow Enzyme family)